MSICILSACSETYGIQITSVDIFQYPWAMMMQQGSGSPKKGVWGTKVAKGIDACGNFEKPRGDSISQSAFAWLPSSELGQKWLEHRRPWIHWFQPQLHPDWGRVRAQEASARQACGWVPASLHTCEVCTLAVSARLGSEQVKEWGPEARSSPSARLSSCLDHTWTVLGSAMAFLTSPSSHMKCDGTAM